jgi:hypothetical protein
VSLYPPYIPDDRTSVMAGPEVGVRRIELNSKSEVTCVQSLCILVGDDTKSSS